MLIFFSIKLEIGYRILQQVLPQPRSCDRTVSNLFCRTFRLAFELRSHMGRMLLLVLFPVLFIERVVEDAAILADGKAWAGVDGETQCHLHPFLCRTLPQLWFFSFPICCHTR